MSKLGRRFQNLVNGFLTPEPKDVEGLNNSSYMFYQVQLFSMLQSLFTIENIPDSWQEQYILDSLFRNGYMVIARTRLGVLCLEGGYTGINVYQMPTRWNIANPVLQIDNGKIGVDGTLLYFNYYNHAFVSAFPLVKRYALLLAQCDASLNTNLINSRLAHIFKADSKAQMETMKKLYDDVSMGKPAVFLTDNKLGEDYSSTLFGNVKNVFIGQELLDVKRTIKCEFLTSIGINNANTDKRERLNSDEVNANNGEVLSLINLWEKTLNSCMEEATKIFPELSNVRFKINETVVKNYQRYINGGGNNELD